MAHEVSRWVGLPVSSEDGQSLGEVQGTLWTDASGAEILGVTGSRGAFVVAVNPMEFERSIRIDHTFDFIAIGPTVGEIDELMAHEGLQAAVSKVDEHYEMGFGFLPGRPDAQHRCRTGCATSSRPIRCPLRNRRRVTADCGPQAPHV